VAVGVCANPGLADKLPIRIMIEIRVKRFIRTLLSLILAALPREGKGFKGTG
jgi:hypothetical protein